MPNKITGGKPGPGRPKGSRNKTTGILKDALLLAAENAGGKQGMVGYLQKQATENPAAFMALLGRVIPLQVTGEDGKPIRTVTEIKLVSPSEHADD